MTLPGRGAVRIRGRRSSPIDNSGGIARSTGVEGARGRGVDARALPSPAQGRSVGKVGPWGARERALRLARTTSPTARLIYL
jgi:hypothetical protein